MSWAVIKTVSGWRCSWTSSLAWASVPLNQWGSVRFMSLSGCDVDFGKITEIAEKLRIARFTRRHGSRHSDARRHITQELADALNAAGVVPEVREASS